MTWLWWKQGGEIAALRTDLAAAYAELETLRARPEVVSPAPAAPAGRPIRMRSCPPADAPDAGRAVAAAVELVARRRRAAPPAGGRAAAPRRPPLRRPSDRAGSRRGAATASRGQRAAPPQPTQAQ